MSRHARKSSILLTCWMMLLTGCQPIQPFYVLDDGDLSHLVTTATAIEDADVEGNHLAEVLHAHKPNSLMNVSGKKTWGLTLEEAVSTTLANSKVMRTLGGRLSVGNSGPAPDILTRNAAGVLTVYDPAIQESGVTGVEQALSPFDPQWTSSFTFNNNSNPRNNSLSGGLGSFFARTFEQRLGTFNAGLTKRTAYGSTLTVRNRTIYDSNNIPSRLVESDFNTLFDVSFQHPLLARGGAEFNRIAGINGTPGNFNGVVLARINTDIRLADFEAGVRNLVNEVEQAYWNLYFAYRNLDATRKGRDSSLSTWSRIDELRRIGARGGDKENWAQAKEQYYLFRGQMEDALTELFRAESRLRYLMGLAATDDRLIKPATEPTTAKHVFDWQEVHAEALSRSVELRQQRWRIKQRQLELIATKNLLLPQLDLTANYSWEGLGDTLWNSNRTRGIGLAGSTAFEELTGGDFQSNGLGIIFNMPLGFRAEMAAVRNQQLQLLREKRRLEDQELEVSHQISDAIRDLQGQFVRSQTAFNRWVSAKEQVEAAKVGFDVGRSTLDLLLDAQRRQADAEVEFARIVTNYNLAITTVHLRKNSLLEHNGIRLAEGPWPTKAYFDAERRAHKRDASIYLNYGMTRPSVVSRGPPSQPPHVMGTFQEAFPEIAPSPGDTDAEEPPLLETPALPPPTVQRRGTLQIESTAGAIGGKFDWGELGLDINSPLKAGSTIKANTVKANVAKTNPVRKADHRQPATKATNEFNSNSTTVETDRSATNRTGS